MNAAEMYDRVFDVYKKTFGKQLGYAAVVSLMSGMALGFVLLGAVFVTAFLSSFGLAFSGVFMAAVLALVVIPMIIVWQAAASTGAILFSRQAFLDEEIKLPTYDLFRVIGRAVSALFAQVVLAIPYIAVVGGFVFLLFRNVPIIDYLWLSRVYAASLIVLLTVCVAGFFIYMHVFSLAIAVAVNERVLFFDAVRRSFALIKYDFWLLFGLRVLWLVMVFVLAASAQGLLTLLPILAGTLTAGSGVSVPLLLLLQLFTGLLSVVIAFAMAPLDGIFTAVIYHNQRAKYGDSCDGV
ncbi:MAG: hypothetical protein FWE90_00935 [Defluviitaleaceae bacterium]|nr:hypothetical protein [Defluviitaleaceae bacterium]